MKNKLLHRNTIQEAFSIINNTSRRISQPIKGYYNRNNLYQRLLFEEDEGNSWYNDLKYSLLPVIKYIETIIDKTKDSMEHGASFEIIPNKKTIKLFPFSFRFRLNLEYNIKIKIPKKWYKIQNFADLRESYPDFMELLEDNKTKFHFSEIEEYEKITREKIRIINKEDNSDEDAAYFVHLDNNPVEDEVKYKKFKFDLMSFMDLDYNSIRIETEPILTEIISVDKESSEDFIIFELKSDQSFSKEDEKFYFFDFEVDKKNIEIKRIDESSLFDIKAGYYNDNNEIEYIDKELVVKNYDKDLIKIDLSIFESEFELDERSYKLKIGDLLKRIRFFDKNGVEVDNIELIDENFIQKLISEDGSEEILLTMIDDKEYFPEPSFPKEDKFYLSEESIKYKIKIFEESSDKAVKIRLKDEEENHAEIAQRSSIDYFFEEDVESVLGYKSFQDSKKYNNIFKIKNRNRETNTLQLKLSGKADLTLKKLKKIQESGKKIYAYRSTYQLQLQKKFLTILLNRPIAPYLPLLMLGVDKTKTQNLWKDFTKKKVSKWHVLTDEKFEATSKQREFVEIALNTQDFALLEGPPGSGKTTAILELILQYILDGKRVLLAASTHIAVDNILELLIERYSEYLEQVFPIRIGRNWNISELVQEFQIDNLLSGDYYRNTPESLSDVDRLILNSSNLVCGTTFGILQYPNFKLAYNDKITVFPEFDVLIIDEASKTTFQEFIVPALFAKKWILIGDIKQLAPYTENSYVARYIGNYKNKNIPINENLKVALFYKYIFFSNTIKKYFVNYKENKKFVSFCIPTSNDVISFLKEELKQYHLYLSHSIDGKDNKNSSFQRKRLENWPNIIFIEESGSNNSSNKYYYSFSKKNILKSKYLPLILAIGDFLIIEKKLLQDEKILNIITPNYILIGSNNEDLTNIQYYKNFHFLSHNNYSKNVFDYIYQDLRNINQFIAEKNWESELAWRLTRIFELREIEESARRYSDILDILIPRSYELKHILDDIWKSVYPSILEVLQKGLTGQFNLYKNNSPLRVGLDRILLEDRHRALEYQMRMHPDISKFSREIFYDNNKLKDSSKINRDWSYKIISDNSPDHSRFVWIDITFNSKRKTKNYKEAEAILYELKRFTHWANTNGKKIKDNWNVAVITYYNAQRRLLVDKIQRWTGQLNHTSTFQKNNVIVYVNTVDKVQGREADIVLLSMVRNLNRKSGKSILGFMDNPNRLNVAITRAKYQLIIYGDIENFADSEASYYTAQLTNYIEKITTKENIRFANQKKKQNRKRSKKVFIPQGITNNLRKCEKCGEYFKPKFPNHKYCNKCFNMKVKKRRRGY